MSIWWLVILLVYGLVTSWENISILFWLLLIVFLFQDLYDVRKNR